MKINKINDKNSFFTIQFEDTDDKEKGIYLTEIKETKTKGIYPVETFISTLIYIQQKIRSEKCIYYKVCFFDGDKQNHKFIKANNLFNDSPKETEDFAFMVNNGLLIGNKCKYNLIDFLKAQSKEVDEIQGTDRMGWTSSGEYIGNGFSTSSDIVFTGQSSFKFQTQGNKEEYFNVMQSIYTENPLVFAINSYQNSAYFLHFLNNEINQTLSLNGTTSKGKSTVGKTGLSWGTNPKNFHGLNSTKGNILSILKHSNHSPVFFDEVAETELRADEKKTLVYSLANGTERGRLHKSSDLGEFVTSSTNEKETLKYTTLIAGEESFLNGIKIEGQGIDARYLEILLPPTIPLWDSINTPEEAEGLNKFIHENYGFIAPKLIELIKERQETLIFEYEKKLLEVREEFGETSNVIKRKVRILAYTYIICLLVAEILLEDVSEAKVMADNAIDAFKKAIFSDVSLLENDPFKEILSHIQDTLYKYLEDRDILNEGNHLSKRLGYIKLTSSHKEINIISNSFSEVCQLLSVDEKLFISYLKSNNLLECDSQRNTKKIMINGNRASYYCIKIPLSFFNDIPKEYSPDYNDDEEEIKAIWK